MHRGNLRVALLEFLSQNGCPAVSDLWTWMIRAHDISRSEVVKEMRRMRRDGLVVFVNEYWRLSRRGQQVRAQRQQRLRARVKG